MTEHVCNDCGTPNAVDARFCVGCDEYLGWDSAANRPHPDQTTTMPAEPIDSHNRAAAGAISTATGTGSPAQAPEVELPHPEAVLDPDAGVGVVVRNPSTIVDAYQMTLIAAPPWMTLSHPEVTLMPGTTELITATFAMTPGARIPAQTITVGLRVCSQRDAARFTELPVTVTVPQSGSAVTVTTRPTAVRLVDQTTGGVEVLLDNTSSNYPHNVALAGSDAEGKVTFTFSPPWLVLESGQSAKALAEFTVPEVRAGETQVRQLTITATEDNTAAEATVIVNQERTVAAAPRLRMDPSSPRVQDSESTVVTLIVDNRESTTARTVQFEGRDPEGVVRFAFADRTLPVPAGRAKTTSHQRTTAPDGQGVIEAVLGGGDLRRRRSRGNRHFRAVDVVTAYSMSRLTVTSETLRSDEPQGQLQFCIENRHESQWLQAGMSGTDLEGVVQFEFSPPGFDVPPGGVAWGLVSVSAPAPGQA